MARKKKKSEEVTPLEEVEFEYWCVEGKSLPPSIDEQILSNGINISADIKTARDIRNNGINKYSNYPKKLITPLMSLAIKERTVEDMLETEPLRVFQIWRARYIYYMDIKDFNFHKTMNDIKYFDKYVDIPKLVRRCGTYEDFASEYPRLLKLRSKDSYKDLNTLGGS